jgi:hypothetical protein
MSVMEVLKHMFLPSSPTVIGASREPKIFDRMLRKFLEFEPV